MKIKFEIKDNITIDNNYDRILEKRYKDGKKIQMAYDAVGNLIGKTRINGGMSTTIYAYNDQDQLTSVKEDGLIIASYGYDHKRQRVYSNSPGSQTYDGQKIYYWDTQGRIIGEQNISYAGVNANAATVRYIYSGNQKVAMARPKDLYDIRAGEDVYYFINNAQGTPVIIVDSAGKSVSKINLDEWGNPGAVMGSKAEINYTGKKLDARTGLYYFNQRYYDPEIGRFLTEDPKGQCFNPYLYSGNNPLMYVDPDGEFFQFLIPYLVAAIQGAAWSAGINASMQLAFTGEINFSQVGQSAIGGAISAGLSFGVGELGVHLGLGDNLAFKTVAHGISGGIQSQAAGGNFGTGLLGGAIGNVAGGLGGDDLVSRTLIAGTASGLTSALTGGNFGQGFQAGAYNEIFNFSLHALFVPRYGNFGGPGWTGGTSGHEAPVDSMDELFAAHDGGYASQKNPDADIRLLRGLEKLPQDPKNWARVPQNSNSAIEYRQKATQWFRFKLIIQTGEVY